ncbi:MAG: DoxX family membrane protein [Vicinamibacterales bacterium]|nr:DoxX family membrane protein [Vicinamibacterales bacterium]
MAQSSPIQRSGGQKGQAIGLVLVRISLGVYLFCTGASKISWLLDSTHLTSQFGQWLSDATPMSRWYLDRMMPGAPIFARIIPVAEMAGGLGLALGAWPRLAAALCLVVVLNLQVAAAAMFRLSYLTDATGLPIVGALLGLMIGGGKLPLSLRK